MSMHLSEMEGVLNSDIMVITSELGQVTVRINLPALISHVDITGVTHDQPDCGSDIVCFIENAILDIASGMNFGMTIDESSSYIEQAAEVCVIQVPACAVKYPLLYTEADLKGVTITLIEESDVPPEIWELDTPPYPLIRGIIAGLNDLINNLMHALVMNTAKNEISAALEDEEGEKGMLIELISFDIVRDGCMPPHEMRECGTPCGIVPQSTETKWRAASLALYGLPAVIIAGLLFRHRKRQRIR